MDVPSSSVRRLIALSLSVALLLFAAGCGSLGGDQNTFAPEGDVAKDQLDLFLISLWPAIAILIAIFGATVYVVIRFRRKSEDEPPPPQVHGNTRLEIIWSVLPALLLLVLAVPVVTGIIKLGKAPSEDALRVNVQGFQWQWRFEYPDLVDAEGNPLVIIGTPSELPEMHVPVDREITVSLTSVDVIHSFWLPKLVGKLDVVPGRTNRLPTFKVETPGVYPGQCAEFCGTGHSGMKMTVIAETEAEFDAWVSEQLGTESVAAAGPDEVE